MLLLFSKITFFYRKRKKKAPINRSESVMLQHPTMPRTGLKGRKGDTHMGCSPCCKVLQTLEIVEIGSSCDCLPVGGGISMSSAASDIPHTADGSGTLCHLVHALVIGNPKRTCQVPGLTLDPAPLSLCLQNCPATCSSTPCTQY